MVEESQTGRPLIVLPILLHLSGCRVVVLILQTLVSLLVVHVELTRLAIRSNALGAIVCTVSHPLINFDNLLFNSTYLLLLIYTFNFNQFITH